MASKVAIEMTWENMAQVLVRAFPDLREPYEELLAWWSDPKYAEDDHENTDDFPGNHVVYGDIFTPYIIRLLWGLPEDEEHVDAALDFLEGMCLNKDVRVQEVAVVTVLEYVSGRPMLMAILEPRLGPVLREELDKMQDAWDELEREYRKSVSSTTVLGVARAWRGATWWTALMTWCRPPYRRQTSRSRRGP